METKKRVRKLVLVSVILALVLVPVTAVAGGGAGDFGTKSEDPDGWARPEPGSDLDGVEADPLQPGASEDPGVISAVGNLLRMLSMIL
jgi:hypothetical protein